MADTTDPVTPVSNPTTPPVPMQTPDAPVTPDTPDVPDAPEPGWKSSEAWVTFLTLVIGAIPSSGLVNDSPLAAKIVGLLIAVLSSLHYTAKRTALKHAHVIASTAKSKSK